jgi:microcystin-dependent protein
MSQPYIGEIRIFAGNFPPSGWAFCDGTLLPISENDALFTLIGTTYGGDGQVTFALPDLRGRVPVHQGTGTGQAYVLGEMTGVEQVTLTQNQIPAHTHPFSAAGDTGTEINPAGNLPGNSVITRPYLNDPPTLSMNAAALAPAGGNQPHDNMQPYLGLNFILALYGIYPPPN